MKRIITKVKTSVKNKMHQSQPGWSSVLSDLRLDEAKLQALISIVERKIERREPWPGSQSASQNLDQQHSV